MKLRILLLAVVALGVVAAVSMRHMRAPVSRAQGYTSPFATATVTIAGHKIDVEYYAPSAHGRKIMGGLVPFDEVWWKGANWATKIPSDAELQAGDLKLPKGSYSIWTIP